MHMLVHFLCISYRSLQHVQFADWPTPETAVLGCKYNAAVLRLANGDLLGKADGSHQFTLAQLQGHAQC